MCVAAITLNIVIIKYYTHCTLLRKCCCVHLLEMCPLTLCVVVLVFLFSISKPQQQQKIKCQRVEMRE
jgi:hypothetical protein